jgi:Luciferase-like monooxygenase
VAFEERGARTDESLAIARALWTDEVARYDGRFVRVPPVRSAPKPVQQPLPVWVAGNSARTRSRAVRLGDGWHAIDLSPAELAPLVDDLRARARAAGRAPETITVSVRKGIQPLAAPPDPPHPLYGTAEAIRGDVAAYAAAGCDYLVVTPRRAPTVDGLAHALDEIVDVLGPGAAARS